MTRLRSVSFGDIFSFVKRREALGIGENLFGTVLIEEHTHNAALAFNANDPASAELLVRYRRADFEAALTFSGFPQAREGNNLLAQAFIWR